MPYLVSSPPAKIKSLPKSAQRIWIKAFNAEYSRTNGSDEKASIAAWAAVKNSGYRKVKNTWKKVKHHK